MRPLLLLVFTACVPAANAQDDLRSRVARHQDGLLALSYAGRADVCGRAATLRIGGDGFNYLPMSSDDLWAPCEPGPVRVLIRRAEGQTVWLRVSLHATPPEAVTDLGTVPARAAAEYFLGFARSADGRVARDALLPAVVADSIQIWRGLLDLARDRALARGLRENAITWLGRELAAGVGEPGQMLDALSRMVMDPDEPAGVRSRAVTALGRSGDPRARETLRRAARDEQLGETERATVIRTLAGREATPSDFRLLRELWPGLQGQRAREAVFTALADAGGSENVRWLLGVAGQSELAATVRARAVSAAVRAGATTSELIRVWDTAADRRVKEALLAGLLRIGDRAALAQVSSVALGEGGR